MKYLFRSIHCWVFCVSLWIFTPIQAQELDLPAYIALVKKNNLDLKQSAQQILIAKEETKVAKAALLPNVTLSGFYQRDFNRNFLFINDFDGSVTRFRTNFNNSVNASAELNQTVFDPAVFSAIKIVKLAEEISGLNDQHLANELIAQASALYWQAIFTEASIKVLEENSGLAKAQLTQLEKLHEKGTVSDLQLQQTKIHYQKTLPPLKNAKNQLAQLINDLKILADLPVTEEFVLADDLQTIGLSHPLLTDNTNLEEQPQLKTLKKELEIANRQINIEKKFWMPKFNLAAAYTYDAQANNFSFSANENRLFIMQLGVSIPIFSGGSNKAKIAKATIEKETAALNFSKTKRELSNQLQTAQNNYHNAVANIETFNQTILLNESEINIFQKQLDLGVVTPLEFKESRLRLTQSKLDLLNAYLDLHIAQLQMLRITGKIN
ncbi:TolC family protein [Winogradskyella sp.]|uniref:TolC family protein n=1 Tax=Winogradskyella sp. TaxID=1883156 RepID=UPI00261374FA|nr:TolC family protein [Winogradskyella sp.]